MPATFLKGDTVMFTRALTDQCQELRGQRGVVTSKPRAPHYFVNVKVHGRRRSASYHSDFVVRVERKR